MRKTSLILLRLPTQPINLGSVHCGEGNEKANYETCPENLAGMRVIWNTLLKNVEGGGKEGRGAAYAPREIKSCAFEAP